MHHRSPVSAFLVLASTVTAGGSCSQPRPSFHGEAPPEVYLPPEVAAPTATAETREAPVDAGLPASAEPARLHLLGDDRYPCSGHPICSQPSPGDGALHTTVREAEFIDPSLVTETEGFLFTHNLFEGLLGYPMREGAPVPGVALRYEVAPDRKRHTFTLRPDARWSNGRPVTAQDFVYSWLRKLDPKTGSSSADHLHYLENARAYNEGTLTDPSQVGLRALDDHTLEVVLEQPTPWWLLLVQTSHYAPVPREAIEARGKDWTLPEHIVTNGPYHLERWNPRAQSVLVKSETYWGRASVRIPRIVLHYSDSTEADLRLYQAGEIQWLRSSITTDKIDQLTAERRPDFTIDPRLCVYFYSLRHDRPPFDDPLVRRAFSMAIDKERLTAHVVRGGRTAADTLVPAILARSAGMPPVPAGGYDPARARQLLGEAGYPQGVGLPKITLVFNTDETHRAVAEFVQRSLKETLGVEITLENVEWKSLLKQLRVGDFQIARQGWCAVSDPHEFIKIMLSGSPHNYGAYKSPELDRLLAEDLATESQAARMELLARAEGVLQRDVALIPMYHYAQPILKWPVLRGFDTVLDEMHLFKYMYWGDKETPTP